ncbi:MAG TPA: hypothetical protein DD414_07145 [Lachnospiraceae bacterium]|nr:hypothetical protein [Lachnospiraceae bacterium]
MFRKELRRLMAALLCGALICTSAGMEQTVYAASADGEDIIGEAEREPAEETVQPVQEESDLQEETDTPSAGLENEPVAADSENEPVSADLENESADEKWDTNGKCGETVRYEIDLSTGVIHISGEGEMENYTDSEGSQIASDGSGSLIPSEEIHLPPWYGFRDKIKTVVTDDSVIKIGDWAFADCVNLESVDIRCHRGQNEWDCIGVHSIGRGAFYGCTSLEYIALPMSVEEVGWYAFINSGLKVTEIFNDRCDLRGFSPFPKDSVVYYQPNGSIEFDLIWSYIYDEQIYIPYTSGYTINETYLNYPNYRMEWDSFDVDRTGIFYIEKNSDWAPNEMPDFSASAEEGNLPPWHGFRHRIRAVVVSEQENIGSWAFNNCANLSTVQINSTVEKIGIGAFYGCQNLESVTAPESVEAIGERAFAGSGLSSVGIFNRDCEIFDADSTFPQEAVIYGYEGSTAQAYAARYNREFKDISSGYFAGLSGACKDVQYELNLATGVLRIFGQGEMEDYDKDSGYLPPWYGFRKMIQTVVIDEGVTTAGAWAFADCEELAQIEIHKDVAVIKTGAFSGCNCLNHVVIPENVTCIEEKAFVDCWLALAEIFCADCEFCYADTFPEGMLICYEPGGQTEASLAGISEDLLFPFSGEWYQMEWDHASSVNPSGTLHIRNTAESSIDKMPDYPYVSFDSYTKRPWEFFRARINAVTIEGITNVGERAFADCENLVSANMDDTIEIIGASAFSGCIGLESIHLSKSTEEIGGSAFDGCGGLKELAIPGSVKNIGSYAFRGCKSLEKAAFSQNMTSVEEGTFSGCVSLSEVTLPNSIISIGKSAFSGCGGLKEIIIPDSVKSIGSYAFSDCKSLEKTALPENMKVIEDGTFSGCTGLSEVMLPDGIGSIGQKAFYGCSNLKEVMIPGSVKEIGDEAFRDCKSLPEITVPGSVSTIGCAAFLNCGSLEKATLMSGVSHIQGSAFAGCAGLKEVTLPDSIQKIGGSAFSGCSSLIEVIIPDGVVNIYAETFYECTSLKSITIPNSVTQIGSNAFYQCASLKNMTIPDSITDIGEYAFYGCKSFTGEIVIPDGVTVIKRGAFGGCGSLSVIAPENVVKIEDYAFSGRGEGGSGWFKIKILNPACEIPYSRDVFPQGIREDYALIYGYKGSTAETHTSKAWAKFIPLDDHQPEKLSGLTATGGPEKIVLSWAASKEYGLTQYRIYRREESEETYTLLKEIDKDTLTYTDTDVKPGVTYSYCVSSVDWGFGEGVQSDPVEASARPDDAPAVTVNYKAEQINEVFDAAYEYSYDEGTSWADCDGSPVLLKPGAEEQSLWIRIKEAEGSLAGNITKIVIPARRTITDRVTVRYKNGVYYLDGLTDTYAYQLSDREPEKISGELTIVGTEGKTTELKADRYYAFLSLKLPSSSVDFVSNVLSVPVERAKRITVICDTGKGTVSGTGEYFEGEEAVVEAAANEGYMFAGWYDGDILISSEKEYRFSVANDISLEARFAAHVHSGGTATCTLPAVCEECQKPYGEPDPDNHTGGTATCTSPAVCEECQKPYGELNPDNHTGGTATCTSPAVCEECQKTYGEPNPDNHTGGTEQKGEKAPTCTEEGYTGDVCCKGCGAKLSDGKAVEKIPHDYADGICKNCQAKDPSYEEPPVIEEGIRFDLRAAENLCYTGSVQKPAVQVYEGETLLTQGTDYTLKYVNNVNADRTDAEGGTGSSLSDTSNGFDSALPYVEVTGKGNYADTTYVNFHIRPAAVSGPQGDTAEGFTLNCTEQLAVNTDKAQKPFRSLKYKKALTENDYTIELTAREAVDAAGNALTGKMADAQIPAGASGTFRLILTGTGNYTGTLEKTVCVADKEYLMKNAVVTIGGAQKNRLYTGEEIRLTPGYYDTETKEYYKITENGQTEPAEKGDIFTVKAGGRYLRYGKDYTVDYKDNLAVGTASMILSGTEAYMGSKEAQFKIKGTALSAKNVTVNGLTSCTYTGDEIVQDTVSLVYKEGTPEEKTLVGGRDYTTLYHNNVSKGKASVTFQMLPASGYTGKVTKTFRITAAQLDDTMLSEAMKELTVPYTKAGAKPEPELACNGTALLAGTDYKVSYTKNKKIAAKEDADAPTMKITGKGNYKGVLTVPFSVCRASLDEEGAVSIVAAETVYRPGKPAAYTYAPKITLSDGSKNLNAKKDYTVAYNNNRQDQVQAYFEALENGASVSDLVSQMPYAVITASDTGNYKGTVTVPLPIYRTKLTSKNLYVVISPEEADRTWTGKQLTPKVSVYQGEASVIKQMKEAGETDKDVILKAGLSCLEEGKDYSLSYGENITAGKNKGSVTIWGLAPFYGGSLRTKFTILSKKIGI